VSLFKRRRFPVEIILLCVRWYCKYGISYRDLAEMMSERGVAVDPSTIGSVANLGQGRERSRYFVPRSCGEELELLRK
jgi:transposase-like protein